MPDRISIGEGLTPDSTLDALEALREHLSELQLPQIVHGRRAMILFEGPDGSGYLLTNNYRAILDYNCSNFYAMSVGLLADAIARR